MNDTTSDTTVLTPSAAPEAASASAVARPSTGTRAISLVSLILSAAAILLGQGPLAIGGIVAGFVARRDEPGHRTLSTWGIVLGFVALFGWVVLLLLGVTALLPFGLAAHGLAH